VDALIGLLLPLALLWFDSMVFRSSELWGAADGAYFGAFKAASYAATACFVAVLAWWLVTRRGAAFCSAALALGCAFALLLGTALLPISMPAISFFGLGLLGLAPFAMAGVYASRAGEAWRVARREQRTMFASAVVGLAVPLLLAGGVQRGTDRSMARALAEIRSADATVRERGLTRLRWIGWLCDPAAITRAFEEELDPERKERLADAYFAWTGSSIESAFID